MGFQADLLTGKQAEQELVATLTANYPKFSDFQYNDSKKLEELKKYDVTFSAPTGNYSVEVKYDVRSSTTGNFAFEVLYKGKPSGVSATEADFFAVKSGNSFYVFDTPALRQRLLHTPHKWRKTDIINGTATVILVPMDEIKELATILPVYTTTTTA